MATSTELYKQQRDLLKAMEEFKTNVNSFINKCSEVLTRANSVKAACYRSNDTNIKNCASSGGIATKLADIVSKTQNNVATESASALAKAKAEADRLGQLAAEAAAREAAEAQAARAKAQEVVKNVATAAATQTASQVIKPMAKNVNKA